MNAHAVWINRWKVAVGSLCAAVVFADGCAQQQYRGVVRPMNELKQLSPELAKFGNQSIEDYFKANPRPEFPTTLAIAKLAGGFRYERDNYFAPATHHLLIIKGDEADGWRKLASCADPGKRTLIRQIQFISPLVAGDRPSIKTLRTAAAQLHAPLFLIYSQDSHFDSGYNDAAMLYWTIVGLFFVPGNTVGQYSSCQAVLMDTRTGLIIATAQGDSKKEEKILWGAVSIAERRVCKQAEAESIASLQNEVAKTLPDLAVASVAKTP